jgi:hypothetical protein
MSVLIGRVRRRARRCAVASVGVALLGATLAGCMSPPGADADNASSSGSLAAQRAGYVDTMLSNSYATGPETERGIMSVIAGFGGGYVTSAVLSGTAGTPTEQLTLDVVLGAGQVIDSMQGEGDKSPSDPRCYIYTVGFYSYDVKSAQTTCPAALTMAKAQAIAKRQLAAELVASKNYGGAFKQIPDSLAAAEDAVGFTGKTPATTAPSGSSFAAGPGPEGKPAAGLAVPQSGGACIYVVYRWIKFSPMPGTQLSTTDGPSLAAWAAPTDEPCRGSAALAAAGFITVDTYEGG